MSYTPEEIVNYIFEHQLDQDFIMALMKHTDNYSIGEITDRKLLIRDGKCRLVSQLYKINTDLIDDQLMTAVINGLYVSVFISRKDDSRNLHFLTHRYPVSMKDRFEEQITEEVVRYMIFQTVLALKLNTPGKIQTYVKNGR